MPSSRSVVTERGTDRYLLFTDAVVAVAITMLVLPLVDDAQRAVDQSFSFPEYLSTNLDHLSAFFLSFVIIGLFWGTHHRFCEYITSYNKAALWLNLMWLLGIVFLTVSSELWGSMASDVHWVKSMYAANLLFIGLAAYLQQLSYFRHQDSLSVIGKQDIRGAIAASGFSAGVFLLSFILTLVFPSFGFWQFSLLLLLFSAPLGNRINRKSHT